MKYNKIILINTFASLHTHEMFDYCWVKMCSMITKNTELYFLKDHIKALEKIEQGKINNVTYKPICTIEKVSRVRVALRFLLGPIYDTFLLFKTQKEDIVIFPFNNVLSLYAINFLNKSLKRKIIICCHGELETLISQQKVEHLLGSILHNICRHFFLSTNNTLSDSLYFSVIGESIKKNLETIVTPHFFKHIIAIDHPYIFEKTQNYTKQNKNHKYLRIGTIGGLDQTKGVNEYLKLIKAVISKNINIKFSHTGFSITNKEEFLKLGVDIPQYDSVLSRKEYEQRINELDCILFFYPKQSYKITASGAIMDAIKFEKPIVALKNDYFNYIFDKFGNFGYLCDSIEEMTEVIISKKYDSPIDFQIIKRKMSINYQTLQVKNKLNNLFY